MDKKKILILAILFLGFTGYVSASATLQSPADGTAFNYGETIDFTVEVTGSGGTLKFYRDGVNVENFEHSISGTQTYTSSYTPNSGSDGSHTWSVYYTGSNDGSDELTPTREYEVQEDAFFADLAYTSPAEGASFTADSVNFEGEVSTQEAGTLSVIADTCSSTGTEIGSKSVGTGNTDISVSEDYSSCFGDKNWYLKYTGDDGSTETSSFIRSFTVESDASQATINYNSPNDNENIDGDINQEASITYDFDFSGSSGELKLREDGVEINNWFPLSDSSSVGYDYTVTNNVGNYGWNVVYQADDGSSEQFSVQDYEIEDYADRTSLSLDSPLDGATVNSEDVDFEYSGTGEDGDVKLYVDGNLESSESFSDGRNNNYFTTVNGLSNGDHDWYVEYEGDDGSSKSTSTHTVTVDSPTDAEQTTLTNNNPSDGASFVGTDTTISYEADVSGELGTVKIFSDSCTTGSTEIYSTSYDGGSSFLFGTDKTWDCEGTFNWNAEYIGDDGSTKTASTRTFTISSEASETNLILNSPSEGEIVNDTNGDVQFNVTKEGYEGTLELYVDSSGTPTHTWNAGCSNCTEWFTHTVSGLSDGNHSWNVKYLGTDGSTKTSSTIGFGVDTTTDASETVLTANDPTDGQVIEQESVQYNFTVNGNSGSVEIYRNGTKIHTDSYAGGGSQSFSYTESLSNGAYDYYLKYVGDDGSTKSSSTRDFSVDAPLTSSISLDTPADAKDFKNTFPITVDYAFQVSGEPGTVELFRDGNVVKTYTHPEGQNVDYSYSESFSQEGNHTWYVKYTRDSDSQTKTSLTREYSIIQQESVSLSIQSPSDGATFDYDETVKFDYSVSSNVIGTVELLLNGSSVNSNNYASPGNTKFYSYEASDLSGDPYNARVRFTSDDGNTQFSNYVNFSVKDSPVNYIENIQVKYRGVDSGSVDKSILVNLTGNSSIDSHGSVSGDTAVFNDDKWVIENISIPYQDDLVVYDTQGRNDTRSLDLDVSVKSLASHPENANLSYQEKNRTLSVQNNGATFDFNYSCSPNTYGNPANVDDIGQVMSGSSSDFACRWSGDWLNHSSGQFDPTVSSVDIDGLLPMESWIEINNSESVSFPSVKYPEVVPDPTCSTSKPVSVGNNSQVNKTAEIDCDIGDSGDPTLTIDGTDYKWNTTLNLSSDLTENLTLTWDTNKSKLSDWSNKDPGSSIAYFKGISDDILLAESTSSVKIIVPDGTFTGGVGEGLHPARIEYTVGASSGTGSSGGGSSGSTPRIIRNVTGTYNWSVSAPRSQGQTFYNVVGWGGRDLGNAPTRIVVRNLGTGNFTLEARCVSDDNSCEFIELSQKNISLDELENDRQVVQVEGVIPQEIPEDGYRFNIVFEDPEGHELETNFRINKNYAQSLIIRFISKVFGVKEIDFDGDGGGRPVPVPLALPVFLITGFFWGAVSLFIRFAQSNNMLKDGMDFTRGRLIASMLVFILAFIFI